MHGYIQTTQVLLILLLICGGGRTFGQEVPGGMNFQMVARTIYGEVLPDEPLEARISFVTMSPQEHVVYSEVHEVTTDDFGLTSFVIGRGDIRQGALTDIPWSAGQIWMEMDIRSSARPDYKVFQRVQLQTVPYAFYAPTASRLADPARSGALRSGGSPNTRWLTSGNFGTQPPIHFLGSRDAKDLIFMTNDERRMTVTKNGQVQIKGGVTGPDSNPASYPLTITGSKQGIAVEVTGSRSNSTNFLTFSDSEGVWGTVQGQTRIEWESSPAYGIQDALFDLRHISLIAQSIGLGAVAAGLYTAGSAAIASLFFSWSGPGFFAAAAGYTARIVTVVAEGAALLTESINWRTLNLNNLGVTFTSGSADYAEWLPRKKGIRDLVYGEIVGLSNGEVSLVTEGADHLMVVSRAPAFLGNRPADDQEMDNGEKIAFMGQVLVKVAGSVREGDYILPSGNNDGVGIAVSPDNMRSDDYNRIVGVAWEEASDRPLQYVNVAVGMHRNNTARRFSALEQKVDAISAYLEGKGKLPDYELEEHMLPEPEPAALTPSTPDMQYLYSIVDSRQEEVRAIYRKVEKELKDQGINPRQFPQLKELFENPVTVSKRILSDPNTIIQLKKYQAIEGRF